VPVPIETPDLYDALKRGVIEGALLNFETLQGFNVGEIIRYVTASWKIGNVYTFYVVMNKNKWNSLPPDVKKEISDFSKDFIERWTLEWNRIDLEGKDYFDKKGGKIIYLSDKESARWIKAVEPVIANYKKDLVSMGYNAKAVDEMISYVKERIKYWMAQEKAKKMPNAYNY
jgi:TRAP-type C4-dicarboxylate transport system substrate-binding protein